MLRVASQEGILDARIGTCIGLSYCFILLCTPLIFRSFQFLSEHGVVLQFGSVILTPMIVLEMFSRFKIMDIVTATIILTVTGISGGLLGAFGKQRYLSIVAILAQVFAITALGVTSSAAAHRGVSLVLLTVFAMAFALWRSWRMITPLTLVSVGTIFSFAILVSARRPEFKSEVALPMIFCIVVIWLLIAIYNAFLFREARISLISA